MKRRTYRRTVSIELTFENTSIAPQIGKSCRSQYGDVPCANARLSLRRLWPATRLGFFGLAPAASIDDFEQFAPVLVVLAFGQLFA